MKIAINGFGRIGKNFLRALLLDSLVRSKIEVVTINIGPDYVDHVALLFKYDTLLGYFPGSVEQKNNTLIVDGREIEILHETDPSLIDWKKRAIDWVVDCSGKFTNRKGAEKHIRAGARKVLISAPAHDDDVSIVPGVNDYMYDAKKHAIVSLGSCTTNALMPMLKILHQDCGLQTGFMNTVHAYTNSQVLLDGDCKDPRKARAAALNIVPTTTGASKMVGKIIPELTDKISASAVRVPIGIVSFLTVTFNSNIPNISKELINDAFKKTSVGALKGIVDITFEPLVSSDFARTNYSVIVDGLLTDVIEKQATVSGWYDNEWAYSLRLKDFLLSVI